MRMHRVSTLVPKVSKNKPTAHPSRNGTLKTVSYSWIVSVPVQDTRSRPSALNSPGMLPASHAHPLQTPELSPALVSISDAWDGLRPSAPCRRMAG
jgi:hypothetical protein